MVEANGLNPFMSTIIFRTFYNLTILMEIKQGTPKIILDGCVQTVVHKHQLGDPKIFQKKVKNGN